MQPGKLKQMTASAKHLKQLYIIIESCLQDLDYQLGGHPNIDLMLALLKQLEQDVKN